MKIVPQTLPLRDDGFPEIITIGKIIKVVDEDEDSGGGDNALAPGIYALDSIGQVWLLHPAATELFAAFDMKDPQLKRERVEARERFKAKKRRRKKV